MTDNPRESDESNQQPPADTENPRGAPAQSGNGPQPDSGGRNQSAQSQPNQYASGNPGQARQGQGGGQRQNATGNRRQATQQQSSQQSATAEFLSDEEILATATPTLRPTMLRLGITLVVGVAVVVLLFSSPELLGSKDQTNLALIFVQVIVGIAVVKLLVEMLILRRTTYIVTEDSVNRQYSLLGYTKSKSIPYGLIRSTELTQNRIEYFYGVGSIALNRGLGDQKLTAVSNFNAFHQQIKNRIKEAESTE